MGVGQLIRNVITTETDPTVANFTKSLTSNNTILTAVNAATGTVSASVLPSYVDDVLSFANLAAFPVAGETGKIYVTEDNNKTYRWSGSVYVEISSSANADQATKLTTPRTIAGTGDATYSVSFDGSANVSSAITLATVNGNVGNFGSASSIPTITVNAKGQVTAVSTNSIGNELIALQALSDTGGFLRKTGDGTYSIDVNSYLSLAGGNVSGNLGLGVVSPTVKLSIGRLGGAFTVPTLNANTALLLTAGGGTTASGSIISVLGGNTSQVGIAFGDTDASEQGGVYYANSTDTLSLRAGNSVRISVDNTGTTFSSTTPSTSTTTGASVIAGGQGIGGNQHIGGFTSLGGAPSGHPAVKMLQLSGTTGASQGSNTNIAHNLIPSKIVGIQVFLKIDSGYFIPPGFTEVAGYLYTWSIYYVNFVLRLSGSSSASILSKEFEVLIFYKE